MVSFYIIVALFIGITIGSGVVLGYQYIAGLQNDLFEARRELNLELCAKWHNNVEHTPRVRRNLRIN